MNDLITRLLAGTLDSLKAKNPKIFLWIAVLLTAVKAALVYAVDTGAIVSASWVDWLLWGIALVVGSRTTSFLPPSTATNGYVPSNQRDRPGARN